MDNFVGVAFDSFKLAISYSLSDLDEDFSNAYA